jgi:outer membrane protein
MRIFFTAFVLTCLFFHSASAQDTIKYTLKECVNIAFENNLRIKRSVYNIESFNTNLLQAKAAYLPTITLGGSTANNYGRALNPVSNQFVDRNSTNINVFGQANLNLFNGFRTQNLFRQSQRDLSASNEDLNKAKNDIALTVITNYTNVIFNQELFSNARYQLNSSQQQLERIKKQVAAGALPKSNELNQEAQVATNEVNLINQENSLNLSLLQLKQSMQIPGSTIMQVVVPDLSAEDLLLDKSADDIYQIALQTMPELKSAILKVESAALALKANRGNFYPRLSVTASAQSNYSSLSNGARFRQDSTVSLSPRPFGEVAGTGANVFNYVPNSIKVSDKYGEIDQLNDNLFKALTLQVNIPVFNGLQNRAAVQRSIINKELADITVKETQNTLRQSIETAYNDALASSKSYTSSLKQVRAQEEAYRMNKQRFENGATSFVEYQVSENDLFRAKSDLTRAKYNFIFKKKVLDFYQGKPIDY